MRKMSILLIILTMCKCILFYIVNGVKQFQMVETSVCSMVINLKVILVLTR